MITINEKLYNKMPEKIKKHFTQKPNPTRDEVVSLFPYTESGNLNEGHKRGDGTGNSFMGGGGTIQKNYGGDSGSAARFFYTAKVSPKERNAGLDSLEAKEGVRVNAPRKSEAEKTKPRKNTHPTVKPIELMRYLIRLITPPDGIVLDPFTGSGSTAIAAVLEDIDFIAIEKEPEYAEIAELRIKHWEKEHKNKEIK